MVMPHLANLSPEPLCSLSSLLHDLKQFGRRDRRPGHGISCFLYRQTRSVGTARSVLTRRLRNLSRLVRQLAFWGPGKVALLLLK